MQKRSFSIAGHRTSIALEPDFWAGLEDMARARQSTITALIRQIDDEREAANLSSALRLTVLAWYRERADRESIDQSGVED